MAKILVVEDDVTSRDLLSQHLEGWGHHVIPTGDGVEALERAEREEFDLVVSDWMMPRMTGIELCETLKGGDSTQDMPVIMLCGKEQRDDSATAYGAGVDDFLTKPVKIADLQASLSKLLS